MTVVVALNYLTELIVIADTRVSYPDTSQYDGKFGLHKILPIVSPDKTTVAVLTYSGHVDTAKKIFRYLLIAKQIHLYQRKFVIAQMKEDIRRWIEEAIHLENLVNAHNLQIMFCALEPKAEVRVFNDARARVPAPVPNLKECHIYKYTINRTGTVNISREGLQAIIGSGRTELPDQIRKIANDSISFGRPHPEHDLHRAWIVGSSIAIEFEMAESRTVGGPFQIIRIPPPPEESKSLWYWHPGGLNKREPKLDISYPGDGTTRVLNLDENELFIVQPIWYGENWKPSNLLK